MFSPVVRQLYVLAGIGAGSGGQGDTFPPTQKSGAPQKKKKTPPPLPKKKKAVKMLCIFHQKIIQIIKNLIESYLSYIPFTEKES